MKRFPYKKSSNLLLQKQSVTSRLYTILTFVVLLKIFVGINLYQKKNLRKFSATEIGLPGMSQRQQQMRNACDRHGLSKSGPMRWQRPYSRWFLINQKYRLVWCNVFKSGSTSFLNIFNHLCDKPPGKIPPIFVLRKLYTRPTVSQLQKAMNSSTSFIVGRNPFERLVSGYRDKITTGPNNPYNNYLRRLIKRVISGKNKTRFKYNVGIPTFIEFIRFIVIDHSHGKEMDIHFEPVYKFCTPCQFNFTLIVKMETFERDQKFILEQAGVLEIVGLRKDNVGPSGQITKKITNNYLRQLPKDLYEKLVKIYQIDFDIFGYKIPTYSELQYQVS